MSIGRTDFADPNIITNQELETLRMSTALAIIETITAIDFFKPGASKSILENLKIEVRAQAQGLDVSRSQDREALRSLAAKVAKSKTGLDKAGKELVADQKAAIKRIDAERSTVWDELQALQDEVRKPLTDWENAEKDRVAKHEEKLAELIGSGECAQREWQNLTVEFMAGKLKEIQSMEYDWQEFIGRARVAVVTSITQIKEAIQKRQTADAEKVELERLRADAARREQEEREARIAQAAKEEAERKAEIVRQEALAAAETERLRVEAEKFEAEARAKAAEERLQAEKVRAEAQRKADAEQAAQDRAAGLEYERRRSEADAKAAAEKAEADRIVAVEAERQRAEDARKAEAEETAKRERNKAHAAKINREVRDALMEHDDVISWLTKDQAEFIVNLIAKGLIPHCKINY